MTRYTASWGRGLLAVGVAGLLVAGARADQRYVVAEQGELQTSSFTLDFGDAGGISSAHIATTDMSVAIDEGVGTARIASYFQNVESLTLPGGFETGAITVSIVPGSSQGVYRADGRFKTREFYEITFENDLSAFDLESPVYLPGNSQGRIENGEVILAWAGTGELSNPFDPKNPIVFDYTCSVSTEVIAEAGAGDVNCSGGLDGEDVDTFFLVIGDPNAYAATYSDCDAVVGDMNLDGVVDAEDIDPFFACLGGVSCP